MALPKKRTPKSRRNSRRSVWFAKAFEKAQKVLAFSKSWKKSFTKEASEPLINPEKNFE